MPRSLVRLLPLALASLVPGCASSGPPNPPSGPEPATTAALAPSPDSLAEAPDSATSDGKPPASGPGSSVSWAEATLQGMTLRQKVAQMIMPIVLGDYAPKGSSTHDRVARLVEELEVGGVIVSVGSPTDVAVKLNDLQSHARVPLLVGSDLETGPGFRLSGAVHSPTNIVLGGATQFPNLMALGAADDTGLAYEMGRVTALEARTVGIHVPFAPVLDVNNNPDNPIINVRSFGEDPEQVSRLGAALVRGIQEHGAIATGKHFPGHGDTGVDSHLALPLIEASRERMDSVELRPFRAAVEAGIGGIMTAHITVPSLNGGNGDPATLSPAIMDDLLRRELGFRGLLFTDAMDMGAIERGWGRGEATVRAVEAGADVILMPPSPELAIESLVAAVCDGRIPEERIDASVRRILAEKESLGLNKSRTVPLDRLPSVVGIPAHEEVAQRIAERSITVLRNGNDLLPLLGTRSARVVSLSYHRDNDLLAARYFDGRLRSRYPRLNRVSVGRDSDPEIYERVLRQARRANLVVVSLYITARSYAGTVAVPEETSAFIEALAAEGIPHIVVSFGNPYLITEFPSVENYVLAWSGNPVSQRAAAEALFGEIPIEGRLPTAIPGFFEIGSGLQIPARER